MSTLLRRGIFAPIAFGILATASLTFALPTRGSGVVARFEVGGEGGYDYIRFDPGTNRLFVSHGSQVEVLDATTGAKIGVLAPTHGVHGIAIAPEFGHGFITDGLDRSVTMFDPRTLAVLKVIKYTGAKPDAIEYDPETKRIFVANGDPKTGGDLTVIDARTGSITDTVDLGGKLEGMAFDGRGHLFVAAEDKALVHVVDTAKLTRMAQWSLAPGEEPTGLAIDAANHRLFAACANKVLIVVDSDNGRIVATPKIAPDPDGAAFDPTTGRIYASSREGILSVLHEDTPDRFRLDESVTTATGARTLTVDPKTHRIFLPTGRFEPGSRGPVPGSFVVLVVGPQ